MPWKEHRAMSSKIEFAEKASQSGANISALCREYGISRQTGYKLLRRFRELGYAGVEEQSRRPKSTPLATGEEIVAALLRARVDYPRWGPKKLVVLLRRQFGPLTPSERTVHRILRQFGRTRLRRKKRTLSVVERAPDVTAHASNDIWTIDFKGWWTTADGRRCDPLTIRDAHSRYVLALKLMHRCIGSEVKAVMTQLFRRYGVPQAIQCDNGSPFISVQSRAGLTKLSAWWVSLGIRVVRSRPGCPQDNGAHERMHVDVAGDLQADPAASFDLQQRACDRWRQVFNNVRPHEALGGKTPDEVYQPTPGKLRARLYLYPLAWIKRVVSASGAIVVGGEAYSISHALHGHLVALEPLEGLRCRVWFHDVDLGEIEVADARAAQLQGRAS
jgi:transposase InsO family protein